MNTILLASFAVAMQTAPPNPGKIVSDMLMKYREAQTVVGHIALTVTESGASGKVNVMTNIQYAKPGKLYIKQSKANDPKARLVTSDGVHFSYDLPDNQGLVLKEQRLIESIKNLRGEVQSIQDIYAAATASLFDRSAPLDIVMSRKEDLEYLNFQWATVQYRGKSEINGKQAHIIGGDWRPFGTSPVIGQYEFCISEEGDLLKFVQRTQYRVNGVTAVATYVYDVNVVRGAKPDEALFKVIL